jgi:isochorismate pyruvate lyase
MKDPESCKSIEEIRQAIDEIDCQILKLFSERYGFVKAIVKFKTDEASVIAENRQKEVIEKRREWATELGLNPDLFEDIYWTLMRYNVRKELEMLNNNNPKPV